MLDKGDLKDGSMIMSHLNHCKVLVEDFLSLQASVHTSGRVLYCLQTREVVMKGMHFIGVHI